MIAAGMEAILIKVAGIGLTLSHLGKTLDEMQPTLINLVSRFILVRRWHREYSTKNTKYGLHICGEGGEYETLTLDCPLFKYRIVL